MYVWVIEFRNGSFFQSFEADQGGPRETALRFDSKEKTKAFMDAHEWIYSNGGMPMRIRIMGSESTDTAHSSTA